MPAAIAKPVAWPTSVPWPSHAPNEIIARKIIAERAEKMASVLKRPCAYSRELAGAPIVLSDVPMLNYQRHLFHEKTLRSVTANTRRDGEELLKLAVEIPLQPKVRTFPLADANAALRQLKSDAMAGSGVLMPA